ncbi:MAG TPA: NADH-quinone oxidoreductase subunit C [Gammaproteobacteria bacterium]|nr:NADH-quinone oxidoreductase subunit C [Gammaproteobacteria bacterium]
MKEKELSKKYRDLDTLIVECMDDKLERLLSPVGELGYLVAPEDLSECCLKLRDEPDLGFEMLMDVCGVDYLGYGRDEWHTEEASATGFSRGVERDPGAPAARLGELEAEYRAPRRFAVVYHLLSIRHNRRLRLKVFCADDERPQVPSVTSVWGSADWFEREAFDLFGILFRGHPDLRRLLTDYGFIGHPFRKDFPLIGNVEMRYDPEKGRVVYEPVQIEPRTLVPKVIRDDARYDAGLKDRSDA